MPLLSTLFAEDNKLTRTNFPVNINKMYGKIKTEDVPVETQEIRTHFLVVAIYTLAFIEINTQ